MLYKPIFFGYIAAAIAGIAALVLILIMLHQDRQYERKKLLALTGLLIGSLCMSTMYLLAYFDGLTRLAQDYLPVERGLDIAVSFVINLFLMLFLFAVARPKTGSLKGAMIFRAGLAILLAAFLFAGIVYVTLVTEDYHVAMGHQRLVEVAQVLLTLTICAQTVIFTCLALRMGSSEDNPKKLIALMGLSNLVTALYNGIGSLAMFRGWSEYAEWAGVNDFNNWLFIINNVLILLVVIWFYNRQIAQFAAVSSEPAAAAAVPIDANLGLTPRETEITQLILQRHTYREIAEQLSISEYTVKRHVHNIYEKAGVSKRDELIRKLKG